VVVGGLFCCSGKRFSADNRTKNRKMHYVGSNMKRNELFLRICIIFSAGKTSKIFQEGENGC